MKKIVITLIAVPLIFWGIWIAFPKTSIQSIIEDSLGSERLTLEVKGFRKGLFYSLSGDRLALKRSGEEQISLSGIRGRINPLSLIVMRLNLSFDGNMGGGNISGLVDVSRNKTRIEMNVKKARINEIPLFKVAGLQGTGIISGRLMMADGTGHVEFITKDSRFDPAIFSGVTVPLDLFDTIRGSMDIKGNIINVVSISLEGKDIYARLKGVIRGDVMDLHMELMPGVSFIENPLFRSGFERYEISPGYYVIPVKGELQF